MNEDLGTVTSVDSGVHAVEIGVIDVAGTIAKTGRAAADIEPVVVVLGYVQVSGVFCGVAVAVADEGRFPVVVEIGVGDCDPF